MLILKRKQSLVGRYRRDC